MTTSNFPLDNTIVGACRRATLILALYEKAGSEERLNEKLTSAIADLATFADLCRDDAMAEALTERDPSLCAGYLTAEDACEEGAELARALLDEARPGKAGDE